MEQRPNQTSSHLHVLLLISAGMGHLVFVVLRKLEQADSLMDCFVAFAVAIFGGLALYALGRVAIAIYDRFQDSGGHNRPRAPEGCERNDSYR